MKSSLISVIINQSSFIRIFSLSAVSVPVQQIPIQCQIFCNLHLISHSKSKYFKVAGTQTQHSGSGRRRGALHQDQSQSLSHSARVGILMKIGEGIKNESWPVSAHPASPQKNIRFGIVSYPCVCRRELLGRTSAGRRPAG